MLALNLPGFAPKVAEKDGKRTIFDPVRQKYVALTPELTIITGHILFWKKYLHTTNYKPRSYQVIEWVLHKQNNTGKQQTLTKSQNRCGLISIYHNGIGNLHIDRSVDIHGITILYNRPVSCFLLIEDK